MSISSTTLPLDVNKVEVLHNKHFKNIYRVGTNADGTCLIHSFLFVTSKRYRDLNKDEQKAYGQNYRKQLARYLLKVMKDPKSHNSHLKTFLEEQIYPIIQDRYESIQAYLKHNINDPSQWLEEDILVLLEKISPVNIIVFHNRTFHMRGKDYYDPEKPFVFVHYITDTHYEAVGLRKSSTTSSVNSDDLTYVIDPKEHAELHTKVMTIYNKLSHMSNSPSTSNTSNARSHLKGKRSVSIKSKSFNTYSNSNSDSASKSNSDTDTDSNSNSNSVESKDAPENTTSNISGSLEPQVERISNTSDDYEDLSSTDALYYETMVAEDDIIFENISDLSELIITRVDKKANIIYNKEQSYNETFDLFEDSHNHNHFRNKNVVDMLFNNTSCRTSSVDHGNERHLKIYTPVTHMHKPMLEDDELVEDYIRGYNDLQRNKHLTYTSSIERIRRHNMFLRLPPPTVHNQGTLKSSPESTEVVRVCDESLDALMRGEQVTDQCARYMHQVKPRAPGYYRHMLILEELNSKINKSNYLSHYRLSSDYLQKGIFSSPNRNHNRFTDTKYHIFNVSEYYEHIKNLSQNDAVHIYFNNHTNATKATGVVQHNDQERSVLNITLDQDIVYKNKSSLSTIFYNYGRNELHTNWCSINHSNRPKTNHYYKGRILRDDLLFLCPNDGDLILFYDLMSPSIEELLHLLFETSKLQDSELSMRRFTEHLNKFHNMDARYLSINSQEKLIELLSGRLGKINPEAPMNTDIKRIHRSAHFKFSTLLKDRFLETYSPIHKKLVEHLQGYSNAPMHRMYILQQSYDNGRTYMLKMLHSIIQEMSSDKIDLSKKISQITTALDSIDKNEVLEQSFYNDLRDLVKDRSHLRTNAEKMNLERQLSFIQSLSDFFANRDTNLDHLQKLILAMNQHFLSTLKIQDFKNESFLKKIHENHHEKAMMGDQAYIDLHESTFHFEDNVVLNFGEQVGTFDVTSLQTPSTMSSNPLTTNFHKVIDDICIHFGINKLGNHEAKYINDNISHIAQLLMAEKVELFKKANPKEKDLKRLFKNKADKLEYSNYLTITVITSYIVVFLAITIDKVTFNQLHRKCKAFFDLKGYPLTEKTKSSKSILQYAGCILKYAYSTNKNLQDASKNEKKLSVTIKHILKVKPELESAIKTSMDSFLSANLLSTKATQKMPSLQDALRNFRPVIDKSNVQIKCSDQVKIHELNNLYEGLIQQVINNDSDNKYASMPVLFQLKKTHPIDDMTHHNELTTKPIEHSKEPERSGNEWTDLQHIHPDPQSNPHNKFETFFAENPHLSTSAVKDALENDSVPSWHNLTSANEAQLTELLEFITQCLGLQESHANDLTDFIMNRFILFDDLDAEQIRLDNSDLISFIQSQFMRDISKLIHNDTVEDLFVQKTPKKKSYNVKLFNLKKNVADRDFAEVVNDRKNGRDLDVAIETCHDTDEQHELIQRLNHIVPIKNEWLLQTSYVDYLEYSKSNPTQGVNPYVKSTTMCVHIMLQFVHYIIRSLIDPSVTTSLEESDDTYTQLLQELTQFDNADDVYHTVKVIYETLRKLETYCTSYQTFMTDYKPFIAEYREHDKLEKFNHKDRMSNEERLLYNSLESIGYTADREEFDSVYAPPQEQPLDDDTMTYGSGAGLDIEQPMVSADITDGSYRETYEGENPDD